VPCGKIDLVRFFSKATCVVAMCMLTFVVVEILACDVMQSDDCYISSNFPDQNSNHDRPSSDSCLCCCSHMTLARVFVFDPKETMVPAPRTDTVSTPTTPPSRIEHPPQLS